MIALLLALSLHAEAGFLQRAWCRCVNALVMNDPTQYETWPEDILERAAQRLLVRKNWGRATRNELIELRDMERELNRREHEQAPALGQD